jgi:cob(I)alamin adenosyltransferase
MDKRTLEAQKIVDEFVEEYGLDMLLNSIINNLKKHEDKEYIRRVLRNLENTLFIYRCRYVKIDGKLMVYLPV